ncbi:MAG: hypothetical protein CVU36_08940 [Betaproteobacteria bacterium HGW-Betaproteobacteria-9]|jgi:hypothetical protein|nr:MAG: hypothetical protein CVU36_08940 [Betaproteobacteria bacterium HGW-Betaproteobacteria-9]
MAAVFSSVFSRRVGPLYSCSPAAMAHSPPTKKVRIGNSAHIAAPVSADVRAAKKYALIEGCSGRS